MSLDRNAANSERLRRNAQRARTASGGTSAVKVTAPLSNTGSTIILNLDSAGGLETSSQLLRVKLIDTSLARTASGVGVALAANSGLSISSGLKIAAVTTKGDILVFDTAPSRLAVGSNNQFLVADSTTASGLRWSTPFIENEVPSGTQNSVNTAFTLANTPVAGSVQSYKNGLRQKPTTDFSVAGNTITYVVAPAVGDTLLVDYRK